MVLDTSAIVALLLNEGAAPGLLAAIERDPTRYVSAASVIEASMVMLRRHGEPGDAALDRLLRVLNAQTVPVDAAQVAVARDAAFRYRRGAHAAALNFGDCFSYALATALGEPLLFTGADFTQTDVPAVAW